MSYHHWVVFNCFFRNQSQTTILSSNQTVLYTWDDPTMERTLMWNVYGRSKPNYPAAINKVCIILFVVVVFCWQWRPKSHCIHFIWSWPQLTAWRGLDTLSSLLMNHCQDGTQCGNNFDSKLIQLQDIESTLNWCYFNVVCPLGWYYRMNKQRAKVLLRLCGDMIKDVFSLDASPLEI